MKVLLFAAARDAAGTESITLPSNPGTVAELRAALSTIANLAPLLPRCGVAVNLDYATDDAEIPAGAEVALLPPVGGG